MKWNGRSRWTAVTLLTMLVVACLAPGSTAQQTSLRETGELHEGWYARIVTPRGEIVARLLPEQAPQSVAHFTAMAEGRLEWTDPQSGDSYREPYYDGVEVQRVMAAHHFEVGRRSGRDKPGPVLFIAEEGFGPVTFGGGPRLGMNRQGSWISAYEFFVTPAGIAELDGRFPCFGEVVHGAEVAYSIAQVQTDVAGHPLEEIRIDRVEIFSAGSPPPLPKPVPFTPEKVETRYRFQNGRRGTLTDPSRDDPR